MLININKSIRKILSYNSITLYYSTVSSLPNLSNNNTHIEQEHETLFTFSEKWNTLKSEEKSTLLKDMTIKRNFLHIDEEKSLFKEVEPYLKRMRYEFDHWDDAIHGFRETERLKWTEQNTLIIKRVRDLVFPPDVSQLAHVHVLDLAPEGVIKPHIDAVRFCGNTIAGLCLLSDAVMRLVRDEDKQLYVDILLKRFSLYIMKDTARYNYTHEVFGLKESFFNGKAVPRDRRISIVLRNSPVSENKL